ncbi:MAG: hypothetical protein EXR86_16310 [Gammaproteobacteria bacterium]|nr:hypothetical protein [Gammaproteobacteria bacterium]
MSRVSRSCVVPLIALTAVACAAPISQIGTVTSAQLATEALEQQRFAIESDWQSQLRLQAVALPLLKASLPLCGADAALSGGVTVATIHSYPRDWQAAARLAGLGDTLSVVGVVSGSGAERAGIKRGDRVATVSGVTVAPGPNAVKQFSSLVASRSAPAKLAAGSAGSPPQFASPTMPVAIARSGAPLVVDVPMDTVCAYGVTALQEDLLNAFADGDNVFVTSAMMRFATAPDELETIVAHEIAHNAMQHMDAKNKNAVIGGIFGLIVDIAAASAGVYTGGKYTSELANFGAMKFSQDFEREADYVGLYILARSGHSIRNAPSLWRRMATESPGSIKFASSHPTTAERYIRLAAYITEIEAKQASGAPLLPEVKKK